MSEIVNLTGQAYSGLNGKRIYIAGIGGMVGSAIARNLEQIKGVKVYGHRSSELDLTDQSRTLEALKNLNPEIIIMAAAKVGGIESNRRYPVEFINNNLEIQMSILKAAHTLNVPRVLFLGSSCIYPKFAKQPIEESSLLSGQLEDTNRAYAIAKIAGIEQIQAYRREYGHSWISAMPCNLYGIGDYFNDEKAHVIPGLLRRFDKAKIAQDEKVIAWGSGAPLREFLYIDDLAEAIRIILEKYDEYEHINIGSGSEISIKELTEKISEVVGFKGEIIWDKSKPDGTPRKIMSVSKIMSLGWKPKFDLNKGLNLTYNWMKLSEKNIRI